MNKLTNQEGSHERFIGQPRAPQATLGQLTFHELVTSLTSNQPSELPCIGIEIY